MNHACRPPDGGSAPATLGFNAVAPEWLAFEGAADAAPAVPAAESTLGSHPCVALSSAQVLPEWSNRNLANNAFPANGDNPLNFVSHSRGSLQVLGSKREEDLRDIRVPQQPSAENQCSSQRRADPPPLAAWVALLEQQRKAGSTRRRFAPAERVGTSPRRGSRSRGSLRGSAERRAEVNVKTPSLSLSA